MIKIGHVEEIKKLTGLPPEVVTVVSELANILDSEYGEYRDVDGDDGGYV